MSTRRRGAGGVVGGRLEVRLDPERRRKLGEVAASRGVAISEVVREMIDEVYEEFLREMRRRAAEELAWLAVEEVPDPGELGEQLEGAYDPG